MASAKQDWAKEQFTGDSFDQWALNNAKAVGGVQALQTLIDMKTFEDIENFEMENFDE